MANQNTLRDPHGNEEQGFPKSMIFLFVVFVLALLLVVVKMMGIF